MDSVFSVLSQENQKSHIVQAFSWVDLRFAFPKMACYNYCILLLLQTPLPPTMQTVCVCAFRKHITVDTVTTTVQIALSKATEWQPYIDLYIFEADVWQAFDHLS